jgi:predicted dehydrogenase
LTIKVGLLGCGDIASVHVPGFLAIPGEVQVTAVCDVVQASAQAAADTLGGAQVFADYRDMISEADIDAVDVCLPHHLHADAIVAAATAGKHILCEKPLCLSRQEAEAIAAAVAESGVTLMCAHNQLYYPAVRRARQMLDDGFLGQIYEIRTADGFRFTPEDEKQLESWRGKKETMGGGALIDGGYHPMYTLLYLADSKPVEVSAMLSRHAMAMEGEDSAHVLVRFADGAIGQVVASWAFDLRRSGWRFQVIGERGQLFGQPSELHYRVVDFEPATLKFPEVNAFIAEIADFADCLRDRRPPLQSEVHGVDVVKVILAAYRSQDEKRVIELDADGW